MIYKRYGSTGIDLSVVGFGGMRFESHEPKDWDAGAAVVKAAYAAGINYFDTAPGYGKSEDIFGVALRDMLKTRAERPFYVASKTFGADEDAVRRDLDTSLQRMGLDSIDFYHMWCLITPDSYAKRKRALKAFEKVKEEGLVKHICVSAHMTGGEIGDLLRDYPFEGVLLGYSIMNFAYREAGIQAAADLNRGVVCMNPLGGGLIPQHPERFDFVRSRGELSLVENAIQFLIDDPRITVALVGLANEAQVREAVHAVETFQPLAPGTIERVRRSMSDAFNAMCTGCRYCDDCPQGIPIPKLMEAYNHTLLSGDPATAVKRLKMHWGIKPGDTALLEQCVECGQCEAACTQKLPIVERLKALRSAMEQEND
jgi:uncharacterized protein